MSEQTMSREKQIEEMHELSESIYMSGHGLEWKDSDDIAEQLYNAGYRKQSQVDWHREAELNAQRIIELEAELVKAKQEVAREIFEEIYEDCFDPFGYIDYNALAELKKKYTEGEND